MQLNLALPTEDAIRMLAEDVAAILRPGDTLALHGDADAGKTRFARTLLQALSDNPDLDVPDPVFPQPQAYLADTHGMRLSVRHFNFCRPDSHDAFAEIPIDAALEDGAILVEGAQRAANSLRHDTLWLSFTLSESSERLATLDCQAPQHWRGRLERTLAIRQFLRDNRSGSAMRRHLTGDASTRAYERIWQDGQSRVLMNAPTLADGPPVRDGRPYSQIAHLAESVRPFVAIGHSLKQHGFSAPAFAAIDIDQGLLLLEDLGGGQVVADGAPIAQRYEAAIDLLVAMHGRTWPEFAELPDGSRYRLPLYDETAYLIETELYCDWYVPHITGEAASPAAKSEFGLLWRRLIELLDDSEDGWVMRDFHSPNLIWLPERDGVERIGLIDFQDALYGPLAYDVASLCQDARVSVAAELENRLVARYCAGRRANKPDFDEDRFRRDYAILAAQRATKILGIFARLNDRDGKPNYLRHIPRLHAYLDRCLGHAALSDIRSWYELNAPEGTG